MSPPVIHKVGNEFTDRNRFLQITLGVVSVCRRFAGLVLDGGPSCVPVAGADKGPDPYLDVVLGVAAFSRHAVRHLEALCEPGAPPPTPSPAVTPNGNQSELRRLLV